jgi:hypothetical protein
MTTTTPAPSNPSRRGVFCVLSARSLPYAERAFESLVARSLDDLDITLITDDAADKAALGEAMDKRQVSPRHLWRVYAKAEADERAESLLSKYPHLSAFRFGHPCWRKVTDPHLFAKAGEEMVILDPDLYFPNEFRFESTPQEGLLLMHQPPSCLLPHEIVLRAYDQGVVLAHHVDIGVSQIRNTLDLEWLDWLVGRLGGTLLPRSMHIEAIVWSALAMRVGGGYLDPVRWHCWRHSQWNRLLLRAGASGRTILRAERFKDMKCFHGGGVAKWWIPDALDAGDLPAPGRVLDSGTPAPFEELTRDAYESSQRLKAWARRLGYYRLVKP